MKLPDSPNVHDDRRETPRAEWILLGVWIVAALLLRLFMLPYEAVIMDDGVQYVRLAARLAAGDLAGGLSAYWTPFYPLVVGIASWFTSDLQLAGQIASMAAGTLLVPATWLLARDSYGPAAARLTAPLVALNPQLVTASTTVIPGATYTLLMVAGAFFGWRALQRQSAGLFAVSGLCFSALFLARAEGLGFVVLFLAVAAVVQFRQRHRGPRVWLCYGVLAAVVFVSIAPYLAYVRAETGMWTISQKFAIHFGGRQVRMLEVTPGGGHTYADLYYGGEEDEGQLAQGASPVIDDPTPSPRPRYDSPDLRSPLLNLALNFAENLNFQYTDIVPNLFAPFFLFLAAIGLFRGDWSRRRLLREGYLAMFVVCTFAGYALAWSIERYFYVVIPFVLVWVARGVLELQDWACRTFPRRVPGREALFRSAVLAVLVLATLPRMSYPIRRFDMRQATELKQAGDFLAELTRGRRAVVLANTPVPVFYAGDTHHYLPNLPLPELLDYARRRDAEYLLFWEKKIRVHGLASQRPLLEGGLDVPGLERVYRDDHKWRASVTIYRIQDH